MSNELKKQHNKELRQMGEEIVRLLDMSDEERERRYGVEGWKILVKTYILKNGDFPSYSRLHSGPWTGWNLGIPDTP